jgi:hypothetical protein
MLNSLASKKTVIFIVLDYAKKRQEWIESLVLPVKVETAFKAHKTSWKNWTNFMEQCPFR